jgi:conjugative transfer signal peptidase TraF
VRRGQLVIAATLIVGFILIGHAGSQLGLRLNFTPSMPLGLWRVAAPPARPLRGMIVILCIDDAAIAAMALQRGYIGPGSCATGVEPLLKPIAAVAGDIVGVTATGITINGEPLPNTAPLSHDHAGRDLPAQPTGQHEVATDKVWTLSGHTPLSFDSRYYGEVATRSIIGTATAMLVW